MQLYTLYSSETSDNSILQYNNTITGDTYWY